MRVLLLQLLACASALSVAAASTFEARLAAVAIESGAPKGWSADARAELEKHLALVAEGVGGGRTGPAPADGPQGETAPPDDAAREEP